MYLFKSYHCLYLSKADLCQHYVSYLTAGLFCCACSPGSHHWNTGLLAAVIYAKPTFTFRFLGANKTVMQVKPPLIPLINHVMQKSNFWREKWNGLYINEVNKTDIASITNTY